jgi:hypothetical protein
MKKFLFKTMAIMMALVIFQLQAMAGSSVSLSIEDEANVNFDETEIYASFDQINDLSSYVTVNENVTYADVASVDNSMVENVSSTAALALTNANAGDPPFVSAFLWGCVLNLLGVAIVAFTTDMDKDQIMKSVWGCAANSVVYLVWWLIWGALGTGWWY